MVELGSRQRHRHQLEIGEAVLLEELAGDVGDGEVEAGQLLRQAEDLGGGVRVLEAPGVADDAGVEAERSVAGEWPAETTRQPAHDHRGRGRVGVDDVDRPIAVVGGVMVEDDELARRPRGDCQVAEPLDRAAVERDHHLGRGREVGGLGGDVEAGQERVVRRDHEGLRPRRHRWAAVRAAQMMHGEHRAEGVSVWPDVARERDRVGTLDRHRRPVELRPHVPLPWRPRRMSSTLSPVATPGSARNSNSGVRFRRA